MLQMLLVFSVHSDYIFMFGSYRSVSIHIARSPQISCSLINKHREKFTLHLVQIHHTLCYRYSFISFFSIDHAAKHFT
jgi:hypothetical protein